MVLRPGPLCDRGHPQLRPVICAHPASVPTQAAKVRTHLPGLFSAEPLKGSHYTTTFMPLTVLGSLLATVMGTKKECNSLSSWELGVQNQALRLPSAVGLYGHPSRVPGAPPHAKHYT